MYTVGMVNWIGFTHYWALYIHELGRSSLHLPSLFISAT